MGPCHFFRFSHPETLIRMCTLTVLKKTPVKGLSLKMSSNIKYISWTAHGVQYMWGNTPFNIWPALTFSSALSVTIWTTFSAPVFYIVFWKKNILMESIDKLLLTMDSRNELFFGEFTNSLLFIFLVLIILLSIMMGHLNLFNSNAMILHNLFLFLPLL